MALSNTEYNAILREYEALQAARQQLLRARKAELNRVLPGYRALEQEIADRAMARYRAAVGGDKAALTGLKAELEELEKKKSALLCAAGYPDDFLAPPYHCEHCKDTGFADGEKCRCFRQKMIARLSRQGRLAASIREENFKHFSLAYYSDERKVPGLNMSERAYMEQLVLAQCKAYLRNFDKRKGNLLFTGKPGLGKTFVYLSAEELFSLLAATQWRQRAESDEEKIRAREEREFREYIYGCDFLIIDDLGTEFGNAFTASAFFTLLNERLITKRGTLISTNLDPKQLKAQYTERSTSRILGEYDILPFYGSDIRAQKRKQ